MDARSGRAHRVREDHGGTQFRFAGRDERDELDGLHVGQNLGLVDERDLLPYVVEITDVRHAPALVHACQVVRGSAELPGRGRVDHRRLGRGHVRPVLERGPARHGHFVTEDLLGPHLEEQAEVSRDARRRPAGPTELRVTSTRGAGVGLVVEEAQVGLDPPVVRRTDTATAAPAVVVAGLGVVVVHGAARHEMMFLAQACGRESRLPALLCDWVSAMS